MTTDRDAAFSLFPEKIFQLYHEAILIARVSDTRFVSANPASLRLFGYTQEEILQMDIPQIHPLAIRDKITHFIDEIAQGRLFEIPSLPCLKKDGTLVNCDLSCILFELQSVSYIVGFFYNDRELTAIKREKERLEEQVHYSQRLAALGSLAASIGHEINNPLAIATAQLEELQRQVIDSYPEWGDGFSTIFDSLNRIKNIVWGLRNVARTGAEGENVFDAHEVLTIAHKLVGLLYKKDGLEVKLELGANYSWIKGNHEKFLQVILNLLSNAKEATCEPGDVVIHSYNIGEQFIIEVKDHGCGIREKDLEYIYSSFFNVKAAPTGRGLGLAISYSIVKQMSGTINIQSTFGVGTVVKIELPVDLKMSSESSSKLVATTGGSSQMRPIEGTVLVVDDEPGIRRLLKKQLEGFGMQVCVAEDGLEAMRYFRQVSFDYLITDLKMPKLGGVELVKYIRGEGIKVKVIIITGGVLQDSNDDEYHHLLTLVDGILEKPFRKKELHNILLNCLI